MSFHKPIRPYFFKDVAVLGVPLRDCGICGLTTVFIFILSFANGWKILGYDLWLFLTIFTFFSLAGFFLYVHNTKKRGFLNYAIDFYLRDFIYGQNLKAISPGQREKQLWLKNYKTKHKERIIKILSKP